MAEAVQWVNLLVCHDDYSTDVVQRVAAGDVVRFIHDFPWKEEQEHFRARLPDDEPCPAGVQFRGPDHALFDLRRPCRHLMAGNENLGDCYRVLVGFPWRAKIFGLIPSPFSWANRQYSLPDLPTALRMVEQCLCTTARKLWDELEHGEFREYEL